MTTPRKLVAGEIGLVGESLIVGLLLDFKTFPIVAIGGGTRLHGLCTLLMRELTDLTLLPELTHSYGVIHAMVHVHIMSDEASDVLMAFRKVNVEETVFLVRRAVGEGVKRFISRDSTVWSMGVA